MTNRTKALLVGAIVGATAATVAIACYIKKHVCISKVHLFDIDAQAGKEAELEALIPKQKEEPAVEEKAPPRCEKMVCSTDQSS